MLTPEKIAQLHGHDFGNAFANSSVQKLLAHIDAQAARIADLERDAARYQALRAGLVSPDDKRLFELMTALEEKVCEERGLDAIPNAGEFDSLADAFIAALRDHDQEGGQSDYIKSESEEAR
ncbi:hypothetical protein CEK28_08615 [Xenophilus sp. AP218F]|nr:hypothetical protein CEK28_08615 [Xenophilus sp. AP218F]